MYPNNKVSIVRSLAAVVLIWLMSAWPASAQQCPLGAWVALNDGLSLRESCLDGRRFVTVAVDLTKSRLGLAGSRPAGDLPTLDDAVGSDASSAFSLSTAVRDGGPLVAMVAGYPADERIFVLSGLARIDGVDLSERDTTETFKSAMLCLDDMSGVTHSGSRPIVFNAFESRTPVELNERVADPATCRDVLQVGPRIVEYRSKEGITARARRDPPQRYTVFAIGAGPSFYGYFTVFLDPVLLNDVQDLLLSVEYSQWDRSALAAVTLTSDKYSAIAVHRPEDATSLWASTAGDYLLYGAHTRPSPIFLTIDPLVR